MTTLSNNKAKALVLREFNKPFEIMEIDLPTPGPGEVLAKINAAGICGSDVHIKAGHDPRTPLPIILGHEGVGEIVDIHPDAVMHDGSKAVPGTPIVWERSLTCGDCYFCNRGQEFLCPSRQVYGINMSCDDPPKLLGNYASHILLKKGAKLYPRDPSIDAAVLVPATCSGTTAYHAHEYAQIKCGETVLIFGCGPVAIFQVAFALDAGAKWVTIITRGPNPKSEIAQAFGADEILFKSDMTMESITQRLMDKTDGFGVDIVIDTTPDPKTFFEAYEMIRRGGTYINPGLAIPSDSLPVDLYSHIVRKNLSVKGVWASNAYHLEKSIEMVQSGKFPFEKLVTHRFPLEKHEDAFNILNEKKGVKIVFEP